MKTKEMIEAENSAKNEARVDGRTILNEITVGIKDLFEAEIAESESCLILKLYNGQNTLEEQNLILKIKLTAPARQYAARGLYLLKPNKNLILCQNCDKKRKRL